MSIRIEVLEYEYWWEIDHPIYEVNETDAEFEKRQVYIYGKLLEYLPSYTFDWKKFDQLPEESSIDFAIRFANEYAYLLDVACFIPEYYEVHFDFYKTPHIVLKNEKLF